MYGQIWSRMSWSTTWAPLMSIVAPRVSVTIVGIIAPMTMRPMMRAASVTFWSVPSLEIRSRNLEPPL